MGGTAPGEVRAGPARRGQGSGHRSAAAGAEPAGRGGGHDRRRDRARVPGSARPTVDDRDREPHSPASARPDPSSPRSTPEQAPPARPPLLSQRTALILFVVAVTRVGVRRTHLLRPRSPTPKPYSPASSPPAPARRDHLICDEAGQVPLRPAAPAAPGRPRPLSPQNARSAGGTRPTRWSAWAEKASARAVSVSTPRPDQRDGQGDGCCPAVAAQRMDDAAVPGGEPDGRTQEAGGRGWRVRTADGRVLAGRR